MTDNDRGFPSPDEFPDYDERDSVEVEATELDDDVPDPENDTEGCA